MALSLAALSPKALAFEMAGGFAAVEQGDDRMEPAATLHAGGEAFASNLFYYGRAFGPVRQETYLLTAVRRWSILKSNYLTAQFGLVVMDERIRIKYAQPEYQSYNETKNNWNGGVDFGVAWSLPKTAGPLDLSIAWDSHVFPAGGEGGFFLATGRKETISLIMGVRL